GQTGQRVGDGVPAEHRRPVGGPPDQPAGYGRIVASALGADNAAVDALVAARSTRC
ncbi:hypothetical protein H7H37_01835, partial [Mycolicibacterium insubricum]|nr:hypothetical protein [Mycolicibacterium insubricum]